jgi:hypothetical protein
MGIIDEPEGHMARDKRADISVAMPGRKILCELKRDYHPDVRRAIVEQLERFYAHGPEPKGFGVYLVFWYGSLQPRPIPAAPKNLPPPRGLGEMQRMLTDLMPEILRDKNCCDRDRRFR